MSIETKFGTAYKNSQGYMVISSMKEGNHNKFLHRLVFEDFYKIKLPSNIIIHHNDGDKTNNEIWNLIPLTNEEHSRMHHTGAVFTEERCKKISEAKKGCIISEESKQKMREAKLGKKQPLDMIINRSRASNTLGIFRVYKSQNKSCKQGFDYCYNYTEGDKRKEMHSIDILKLRKRVINKGLPWVIIDEEKVRLEFSENTAIKLLTAIK